MGVDFLAGGLMGVDFLAGGLMGVDFLAGGLTGVNFLLCVLTGVDFLARGLTGVDFLAGGLMGEDFLAGGLTGVNFLLCVLTGADFLARGLTGVDFLAGGLMGVDFLAGGLMGEDFSTRGLTGVDFLAGKEALCITAGEDVKVVTEQDGTEVEDGEYFQSLPDNTAFLLLRRGERWIPPDCSRLDVMAARVIPRAIREAIPALSLMEEAPSWRLTDNRGLITVFMEWDLRSRGEALLDEDRPFLQMTSVGGRGPPGVPPSRGTKRETLINHVQPSAQPPSIRVTDVATHRRSRSTLDSTVHAHVEGRSRSAPAATSEAECDFHCCALHRAEGAHLHGITPSSSPSLSASRAGSSAHRVHFSGNGVRVEESAGNISLRQRSGSTGSKRPFSPNGALPPIPRTIPAGLDSSESEGETTTREEGLTEKYLLLADQVSSEHRSHLTVRDLGVILDRLNSRIAEVSELKRDKHSEDYHSWRIRALVRGEMMKNLGVLYQGNYYLICEYPGPGREHGKGKAKNGKAEGGGPSKAVTGRWWTGSRPSQNRKTVSELL
ncbi:unnamed protein product [Cyprideis torosa]|uniref:Uncharacterized protein n=1 Tax=Cyprideis torosa TaxID=163714 RepID=A0A7R8ZMP0_9CRUS|nr:unnamed protein product [Cyprideis torosa]CAG0889428.1 unnamed protein product [Cyprideis torosa]